MSQTSSVRKRILAQVVYLAVAAGLFAAIQAPASAGTWTFTVDTTNTHAVYLASGGSWGTPSTTVSNGNPASVETTNMGGGEFGESSEALLFVRIVGTWSPNPDIPGDTPPTSISVTETADVWGGFGYRSSTIWGADGFDGISSGSPTYLDGTVGFPFPPQSFTTGTGSYSLTLPVHGTGSGAYVTTDDQTFLTAPPYTGSNVPVAGPPYLAHYLGSGTWYGDPEIYSATAGAMGSYGQTVNLNFTIQGPAPI